MWTSLKKTFYAKERKLPLVHIPTEHHVTVTHVLFNRHRLFLCEKLKTFHVFEFHRIAYHKHINWTASSEFGTYCLCEQRRFRRACASAQSHQNLRCSLIQAMSQEEPSDRKPDPWPLWMAGHAQLKFVMTEWSKTQIRLTGLNLWKDSKNHKRFKFKSQTSFQVQCYVINLTSLQAAVVTFYISGTCWKFCKGFLFADLPAIYRQGFATSIRCI